MDPRSLKTATVRRKKEEKKEDHEDPEDEEDEEDFAGRVKQIVEDRCQTKKQRSKKDAATERRAREEG